METVMTVGLFALLALATVYLFRGILLAWSSQERRSGIAINLGRGVEEMVRDLREAKGVQSTPGYREIRYRQGESNYYIFYLYDENDGYGPPPAFNQPRYQLKRAALEGGIDGMFIYGAGQPIVNDVVPPPTSDLSLNGALITIDLSVSRADETIRSKTQVHPRNL